MSIRILFVDDEPFILDGLQRSLRPFRKEWATAYATGGEEALAMLEREPFDVIVTDMRMPGMDGAMLLGEVTRRYPDVLRRFSQANPTWSLSLSRPGPPTNT